MRKKTAAILQSEKLQSDPAIGSVWPDDYVRAARATEPDPPPTDDTPPSGVARPASREAVRAIRNRLAARLRGHRPLGTYPGAFPSATDGTLAVVALLIARGVLTEDDCAVLAEED